MRIGVICPSEIAIRRFMPALKMCDNFVFVGVGVFSKEERVGYNPVDDSVFQEALSVEKEKAQVFIDTYGGHIFDSYESVVTSNELDAVYIPLPPALHYKWAKMAIENGKHVLVEKPSTVSLNDSTDLVRTAAEKGVALHENYMFVFHKQLDEIEKLICEGAIGEPRLYRISFGFPRRLMSDFRYNKALGGGALIDAGGYVIRYATRLLGNTIKLCYAQSNYVDGFEVDMYGSGALANDEGVTAQIAFGMDNNYKCELEAWGSSGCLTTGRVLTAPVGFEPDLIIRKGNAEEVIKLSADDAFRKSIMHFEKCILDDEARKKNYISIIKQAELVEEFKRMAGWE